MDMHDPSLTPGGEAKETNPNLSEAPAAADDTTVAPATESVETSEIFELSEDSENSDLSDTEDNRRAEAPTKESLMARALELMARDIAEISTDDIRRVRQAYCMLLNREKAAARAEAESAEIEQAADADVADVDAAVAAENAADATAPAEPDELMLLIDRLKAKKAAWMAEQEAQRAENLARKNEIIDRIIALAEDTDNVNRTFPLYRELQEQFNAIGDVDPMYETQLWKRYQEARERYSDNLKINKELRDYDFKKNLAEKEALLAEARALAAEEDVITAYRRLQELHNKWRLIGPVAKELREEIWANFREASAEVNRRYQEFFMARKAREAENEAAKTALCERIEALDLSTLKTFAAWEEMTKTVVAIQAEWRTLGFASKKMNRALFARFRRACDAFFAAKSTFFRNTREELSNNLSHKERLVAEAESLKESTDWRATADRLTEIQREWRTIGAIPKKYSDDLWKRFNAACDYFFDRRKKAGSGARQAEAANLRTKREIIGELQGLLSQELGKEEAMAQLNALRERWNEAGHVPFREKDKLFEAFRSAIDAVREHYAIAEQRRRRQRFEQNVAAIEGDSDKLYRERERLARALESRRNELRTYTNNLGFLSSKSKSGDSLVRDMERRIERLKADIDEIAGKIALLDAKL